MSDFAADLHALSSALNEDLHRITGLRARWQHQPGELDGSIAELAERVDAALSSGELSKDALDTALASEDANVLLMWCATHVADPDVPLHPVLAAAAAHGHHRVRVRGLARNRIIQGSLKDALACIPLLGGGEALDDPSIVEAFARAEILIWEAGARALQLPELGKWIWEDPVTFESIVAAPAHGALRGRVLAARCLEVAGCGMSPMTDPELVGRTLQVMQPLLLHPEPIVWVHAARAFGRLAGVFEPLEGTLLDWVHGGAEVLRQRALTAFASLPKERLAFLGHELETILDAPAEKAWGLAAAAAATPYLFHSRRALWDGLADRICSGDGGATAARALGRGLATLWRRGEDREAITPTFRRLRRLAQRAGQSQQVAVDWRRWLELIGVTDPLDAAERDPLDVEAGLENLIRLAADYDDEEADERAARFAGSLQTTMAESRRLVLEEQKARRRAVGLNAYEGCARSLALRLWGPMLATRPQGEAVDEPELDETWQTLARAPAELLDAVRTMRLEEERDEAFEDAVEVLALKLGGYALDAAVSYGGSRGGAAHETCLWLRKLEGLDGRRETSPALQRALSGLFWRLVDVTRGTSLGEVDDVAWLGPFAAWWALVIDDPTILRRLATALPMIADGALETCVSLAAKTGSLLTPDHPAGSWREDVLEALAELHADDTELGVALSRFADALASFEGASGVRPDLESYCVELVLASERLQNALHDPARALHPPRADMAQDTLREASTRNAPRMASVVARAIRLRDLSLLEVWFASLGPTASALVEASVNGAVRRTPPPPPAPKREQPKMVMGYELLKALGEGGMGTVWLVRKPDADRLFVLKIPKADVLQSASETEREGILASFTEEASALAGLYHPNVANIIDRGVSEGMPYLVLEYLIGADLKMYSDAQKMSLYELRRVVPETCAGLTALHNANLVHRDLKPANIWLRLPLRGGVRFDPEKHRNPADAPPLSTVLIDFGMVRAMKVPPDVGGRFVAGTPGYIAPEQVLDPVELDGRADVFALAGTIYNVMTGRTFFDEIEDKRERIVAHMRRDAMENDADFRMLPSELVKLLRHATARDFRDRPTPLEFGRAFEALG